MLCLQSGWITRKVHGIEAGVARVTAQSMRGRRDARRIDCGEQVARLLECDATAVCGDGVIQRNVDAHWGDSSAAGNSQSDRERYELKREA